MVDIVTSLPPWDAAHPMSYLGLRTSRAEKLADGVPSDVDPALSLSNPSFVITIHTNQPTLFGLVPVYAGGELQQVLGPVPVPEPATLALVGIGAGLTLRRRRRRSGTC